MSMMTPEVMVLPPPLPELPTHISNYLVFPLGYLKGFSILSITRAKPNVTVPPAAFPVTGRGALFFQLLRRESFLLLLFLMPSSPSATPAGCPSIDPVADLFHCQHPDPSHDSAALSVSILTPIVHSSLRPLKSVSCQRPLLKTLQGLLFH